MDAQTIIQACQNECAANSGDCNAFVKAVESDLSLSDFSPGDDADAIVIILETSPQWTKLADGVAAKAAADTGVFVIGA